MEEHIKVKNQTILPNRARIDQNIVPKLEIDPKRGSEEYFEMKCRKALEEAIQNKDKSTYFQLSWFKEYNPIIQQYDPQFIDRLYNKLESEYWNHYRISLAFEGCDNGSSVPIWYTDDIKQYHQIVKKNAEVEQLVQTMVNYAIKYHQLQSFGSIGWHQPYIYAEIERRLKPHKLYILCFDGIKKIVPSKITNE